METILGTDLTIEGKCQNCNECCGSITPITEREFKILRKLFKPEFNNVFLENFKNGTTDLTCPFSINKRCSIYESRPAICVGYNCNPKLAKFNRITTKATSFIYKLYKKEVVEILENVMKIGGINGNIL